MPHAAVRIHLVWATRERRPWLDPEWRSRLYALADGVAGRVGGRVRCAGGARDHLHLYVELPPTVSVHRMARRLKQETARWIRATYPHRRDFRWQAEYAAFSVSATEETQLLAYLQGQESLHQERDYRGELYALLEHHRLPYDPRRVFD